MLPVHVPGARDNQGAQAKALNRRRAIWTAAAVLALLYGWRALTYNAPASKGKLSAGATKEDVVLAAADAGASFEPLDKQYSGLQTLVVVAGHAVLRAAAFAGGTDLQDNDAWVLEPHQAKHKEQAESMIKHIRAGIAVARADPAALVLFSGGATRANAGPLTEATSYWLVAARLGLLESQPDVQSVERARHTSLAQAQYGDYAARARFDTYLERAGGLDTGDLSWRVLDEGFARDSYENFLFSLCRFREITGKYPERVVIVGYEFKRARFVDKHRAATGYPLERTHYVGLPAPDEVEAAAGEANTVAALVASGGYGCDGSGDLQSKRSRRDPFHHGVGDYRDNGCPEMRELIGHCGGAGTATLLSSMPWARPLDPPSSDNNAIF